MKKRILSLIVIALILVGSIPSYAFADTVYGKIAFNAGEGTGSMETVDTFDGSTYTIPEPTFYRTGYEFAGWVGTDGEEYEVGDTVQVSNTSENALGLTATWEPIDSSVNAEDGVIDIYLHAGEAVTIPDIPAGTTYQVWEETPDGWVIVSQERVSGIIEPLKTAVAKITNKYQPGTTSVQFNGTKTLDNLAAQADSFSFELWEGEDLIETVSVLDGGFIQFSVINYLKEDIGTHVYTIKEVNGGDETIDYDLHEETVTVRIYEEDGDLKHEVTYDSDGISFANTTRPGSLEIKKNVTGQTDANKDDEFTFKITLENENGTPLGEDDTIYWYKKDASGEVINTAPLSRRLLSVFTGEDTSLQNAQLSPVGSNTDEVEDVVEEEDIVIENTPDEMIEEEGEPSEKSATSLLASATKGVITSIKPSANLLSAGSNGVTKYAVNLYGICVDVDESGDTLGLTFGPAFGGNYVNSYKSHVAKGKTAKGFAHRCIHNDSWETIIEWNNIDPYVYEQCITEGCTHSVELDIPYAMKGTAQTGVTGDGPNALSSELNTENLRWHPNNNNPDRNDTSSKYASNSNEKRHGTSYGGWGASRIRAMLNGADTLTDVGDGTTDNDVYAPSASSDVHKSASWYTEENCLFAAFPIELQLAIGEKKNDSTYDKLWLLSSREISASSVYKRLNEHPAPVMTSAEPFYTIYLSANQAGWVSTWLRTNHKYYIDCFVSALSYQEGDYYWHGPDEAKAVSPCFSLSSDYIEEPTKIVYDTNGGYSNKVVEVRTDGVETGTVPDVTRANYDFIEWNTSLDGTGTSYHPNDTIEFIDNETVILYALYGNYSGLNAVIVNHYQETENNEEYVLVDTDRLEALAGETVTTNIKEYDGFHTEAASEEIAVSEIEGDIVTVNYYYDRNQYVIVFEGNGADSGQMLETIHAKSGIQCILPKNTYGKVGALFTGWNTKPDGTGDAYLDKESVVNLGEDGEVVTLYAQWKDNDNSVTPTSGEFTVTCKAGETIVLPALPAGTKYKVEEVNNPGGWALTGYVNEEGVIIPNTASEVQVNNTYSASGFAQIMAYKNLVGRDPEEGEFTFELLRNGAVIDTKTNEGIDDREEIGTEDGAIANPYYGYAPVYFDEITYTNAGTYTYTIREVSGSNSKLTYDDHTETVTVTVEDAGAGRLEATVTYDTDGAIFTNNMKSGSLEVSKAIEGGLSDTDFTFEVHLKDASGNDLLGEYPIKKKHHDYGTTSVGVNDTKYSHMSNVSDDGTKLYNYSNNTSWNQVVTIPGATSLHVTITYGGESVSYDWACMWEGSHPTYTAYSNWSSSVTGKLGGGYYTSASNTKTYDVEGDTVTFAFRSDGWGYGDGYGYYAVIVSEEETVETGVTHGDIAHGDIVTLKGGESFEISGLPDGATYEIVELDKSGWENTYKSGDTGTITAGEKSEAFFTNEYDATGEFTLEGSKEFIGGDLSEKEFTFLLLDEDGNSMGSATTNSEGKFSFDFVYTLDDIGEHTYFIREVTGPEEDIAYDTHLEEVKITVSDNGDGTLTATPECDADGITFTNIEHATLKVSKEVTGNMGNKEKDFSFTLSLTGDISKADIKWVKNGETGAVTNGTYSFTLSHLEEIEFTGIPKGVNYTVVENDSNKDNYVTTADSEDATISENVLGRTKGEGELSQDTEIKFTNRYDVTVPARVPYIAGIWPVIGIAVIGALLKFRKKKA